MANSDKNIRITPNKGTTSFPKIVFTGQANDPITVNVLDDNSLSFSGSAGQLFSLSNNISSGTIFSVNDISGFPSFRINANGTVSANEFSGNFGIGISNPYYKLQVIGTLGVSGGVALTAGIASTSSSSGTLVVTGGAAIGSSLSVGGSLLLWNGTNYSALRYTGSNNITYTLPTALPGSGTSVLSSDTSGILSWVPMTATGVGGGGAGTVYNSAANLLAYYPSAGAAVTGNTNISASGSGLTIGFTTPSTGATTGALTVAGGVGIGGSLYVNSPSSVSGVNFNNGIVTSGTWAGSTITAYYGGTGYTNYTKGDLLVGLGTTLYKLPVGTQGQLLQAFSTATAGVAWTSIMPPTYGAFYSTTSQTVAGAGISTPLTLNSTFEAYNTQILGGAGTSSRIQIQTAGTYNIQFSAQINVTTGASSSIGDFWFRINGLDVPKSNTEMSIAGNGQQTVLSLNFVSSFAANDYFELVMSSSDIHYQIEAKSGLTSPPRPDIPSLIITVVPVTQVVGSSVGIGVSGLVSLNGLNSYIQYFATGQSGSDFNISSSGFTHTFNVPIAGTASTGLITSQAQTIGGAKTFTSPIIGNLTGIATTATNINSVFATTNASHPLLFTPTSGTASGVAVSTNATLNFNPSTSILNISGLAITSGLASTSSTSGALIVTGGVGIGGSINASLGGVIGGVTITSGTLYGNLTGVATTATYSNQAGYAITSGSSSTATTANYSHQAGYAITSGTAALATTATYAHQSGYSITSGSAGFWITPRTLNLSGDLSGSVVWSGSGDTTLTATIVANAVALGTDTTGQYASTITISGSGITATAANADDGTAYTIYSSASASNIASAIVLRDGSGNFSAGTITGNLTGTATTATYAHQAGYAITSGSASVATTATYSHQAGYAITSGSSSTATTATYAHQAGYGITAGSASAWTTPRTLSLSGDLSGSVVWSGSGDTTLTATIVANAVALGTDTTGQYASTIAISGSGITATAANADDGTAYTIYSSATSNNTVSSIVSRDGSGNFSAGTITANLTGTASTATYAHQSGYAITSGSSSTATTATYSHQSGYAITSGSSALATTASNINVVTASNNIYNPVLFSPQGTGTGVAVSSYPSFSFNPTANILNVSGLAVTSSLASTSTSSGALTVTGGVGIGGSLFLGSQLTQTYSPTTGAGSDHALFLQSVPVNTTVGAVIQIGSATAWDGTTAGFFTGAVSGTYIGINAASGSTAAAIDFQVAGVSKFQVGSGGSTIINNYTEHKASDVNNKALRVLGFSSSTQGDILSFEHPAGGSFTMNGNYAGQAGGRFTIVASGNAQVRAATFGIQASDTKTVINVDATSGAGALSLQNATNLQLFNSTNAQYAGFKYTGSATTTYTLPASAPGAGVSVLQSDTAGVMSWVAMAAAGGGSGTVTTLTAGTGITFSTGATITTTGTIRAKRPLNLAFCSGYTPAASGADAVVLRIPLSPSDGTTSLTYKPQQFFVRVETASATASTVQLEKYTGTSAFSGTAITSIGISGASTYELSTNAFAAAGTLLTSGDKLRINFTALSASHANFTVYLLLEEV